MAALAPGAPPLPLLERAPSCRMARVTLAGEHLCEGNDWDFYPGCHGGAWLGAIAAAVGPWRGPEDVARAVALALAGLGVEAAPGRRPYAYAR